MTRSVPSTLVNTTIDFPRDRCLRILSYYEKSGHPLWLENVEICRDLAGATVRTWRNRSRPMERLRRDVLSAWHLFRLSKQYDVVLTGSDRAGLFFGIAQRVFRRRRVPQIFLDFLVYFSGDGFKQAIRRRLCRLAADGSSCTIVQRTCEVRAFSRALGVPASKFRFIPYHATIYDTRVEVRNDGYIFAGGDAHRDYPLLIEAVRGLPYRVIIAALRRDHFADVPIPLNVEIVTVPEAKFLDLLAGASVVIVPLKRNATHVGGEQTYVNAMTMGKATIVTDLDAGDYIENGKTGILTPAGDIAALRQAIRNVMEDRDIARSLGESAKEASAKFAPERFFEAVFRLCEECATLRSLRR